MLGDNFTQVYFGLDRTQWPFREKIEAHLDEFNTAYLRDNSAGHFPVLKADEDGQIGLDSLLQADKKERFIGSWIGRNVMSVGNLIANQYRLDDATLEDTHGAYRQVTVTSNDDGFTVRQAYYATRETDSNRYLLAKDSDAPALVEIKSEEVKRAGFTFQAEQIDLNGLKPLFVIETRFQCEYRVANETQYLHSLVLTGMDMQHENSLVLQPLQPAPVQYDWLGRVVQPAAPAIQLSHLRTEFQAGLDQTAADHDALKAEYQLLLKARDILAVELDAANVRIEELAKEGIELKAGIAELKVENSGLKKQLVSSEQALALSENQLAELQSKIQELHKTVVKQDLLIERLETDNAKLVSHNQKLSQEARTAREYSEARVNELKQDHQEALAELRQIKDAEIQRLRDALAASELRADAERAFSNRKIEALTTAFAELKGGATQALRQFHANRAQDFAHLQSVLNRNGFFDLMQAIFKPLKWIGRKISRSTPVQATVPAFQAPAFLAVEAAQVLNAVRRDGDEANHPENGAHGTPLLSAYHAQLDGVLNHIEDESYDENELELGAFERKVPSSITLTQ
jgi:archaellum component FlaC